MEKKKSDKVTKNGEMGYINIDLEGLFSEIQFKTELCKIIDIEVCDLMEYIFDAEMFLDYMLLSERFISNEQERQEYNENIDSMQSGIEESNKMMHNSIMHAERIEDNIEILCWAYDLISDISKKGHVKIKGRFDEYKQIMMNNN